MTQGLHVGVGRVNITPPLGALLAGYADPFKKRQADSVHDPLNATALVFATGDRRAAVVSCDLTVIDDILIERARKTIHERTGIDPCHVTISAIQTHSAPRTQRVWGWNELDHEFIDNIMLPGIVQAVAEADASKQPARMGVAVVNSDAGVNRRRIVDSYNVNLCVSLWSVYDPNMTVLRFDTAAGPLANLVHYGAHPTVFGSWSKAISRDWPGIMIDRMEELTGAKTLFINGAVGDIAPRTNSMRAVGDKEIALMEAGCAAAMDAMKAWRSIKDMREVELHIEAKTIELPYRPLPPLEEAERELAAAEPQKDTPGGPMAMYCYWRAVIEAYRKPIPAGKPFSQVVTALGPVAFVPIPGEPFGETIMRLRDASPFQYTLGASTTSGNNGYFPTRESLHRGGYEVWVNRAISEYLFVENIDDVLIDRNLELLRSLHARVYPPIQEHE